MRAGELEVGCPTCGKKVVRSPQVKASFFPFCCERCKLIDLGKWLSEGHRIEEAMPSADETCQRTHKRE